MKLEDKYSRIEIKIRIREIRDADVQTYRA